MRAALLLATALATALCLAPHAASSCEIRMNPRYGENEARWLGPCKKGIVDGYGVLTYEGKGPKAAFYGLFAEGLFVRGVLEDLAGTRSLRTKDGIAATEYDGRAERVLSTRMGMDGAQAASDWLKAAGKGEEAKAYAAKATALQATIFTFHVP